jgi:4,5-dihydroxyphthalate decarboxylase
MLVVRKELLAEHPGLPATLLQVFEESKRIALDVLNRKNELISVGWMDALLEEERSRLREDLYANGLDSTRHEIERCLRYMHEQNLIPEPLAVEDVFAS